MTGAECDEITKAQVKQIGADLRKMGREANLLPGQLDVVSKTIRQMGTLLDGYLDACAAVDRLMAVENATPHKEEPK